MGECAGEVGLNGGGGVRTQNCGAGFSRCASSSSSDIQGNKLCRRGGSVNQFLLTWGMGSPLFGYSLASSSSQC